MDQSPNLSSSSLFLSRYFLPSPSLLRSLCLFCRFGIIEKEAIWEAICEGEKSIKIRCFKFNKEEKKKEIHITIMWTCRSLQCTRAMAT
ncbi:hypothetical protein C5167_044461 [Papaver somniferum]|uniref:Uncharacterized protein n=1 Tax=Papaver somniferum TaxID=3469 RepID=A0A4Y7LBL3_PAPSO|nr:hypothetical protein C5167_044461 [Papaver somniferum]